MSEYIGWRKFKDEIKAETGLSNAVEISANSGVSQYMLDALFNNRKEVPRRVRGKIDRWIKKVTDNSFQLSDFETGKKISDPPESVDTDNIDPSDSSKNKYDFGGMTYKVSNADVASISAALTGEPIPSSKYEDLAKKYDYDVPTLLRLEDERRDKSTEKQEKEIEGWKEEALDEYFTSLDRYQDGLGQLAKKEIDRIRTLVMSHFDLDGRQEGVHHGRQLEYAYIMGIERGWSQAQIEHNETLRHLLGGKING